MNFKSVGSPHLTLPHTTFHSNSNRYEWPKIQCTLPRLRL